jgi:septal ring factor EnvC (AmiA/AmiB activator)
MDLQLARELEDSRDYAAYLQREVERVKRQVNATQRLIEETHAACDRMSRMLARFHARGFGADWQQNNER